MQMKPYQKVTVIYFITGSLWIFFSDRLLTSLANSIQLLTTLQTYKGWFFIILTSTLLYFLVKKDYKKLKQREKEKTDIFYATMSAVNHILNNFLHKMLFFKQLAEDSKEFKKEVLDIYSNVIEETSLQIKNLGAAEKITREEIEEIVYKR